MCGHRNHRFLRLFKNHMLVISFSTLSFVMSWWGIYVKRSLLWKVVAAVLPCGLTSLHGQQSKACSHQWRVAEQVTARATRLQKGGASGTQLKIEPRFPALREWRVWIVKIIFSWVFWWAPVLWWQLQWLLITEHQKMSRFLNKK